MTRSHHDAREYASQSKSDAESLLVVTVTAMKVGCVHSVDDNKSVENA